MSIIIIIALALICGFLVADAIVDYVFIAVYALMAVNILNNIKHLIRYRKKYRKTDTEDIGFIFLWLACAGVCVLLQIFIL